MTYTLIGLVLVCYLAEVVHPALVSLCENWGIGLVGPDGGRHFDNGIAAPGYTPAGVAHGEWYRLITSGFLHLLPNDGLGGVANSGIAHIVMNTLSLWQLGRVLEPLSGRVRFLALYLISALGGSVLEYILVPDRPSVGASGALYGLTAAYFLMSRRSDADSLWARQTVVWSLIWLVLSAGFTSWQGHLGGFVTGSLVAAGFAYTPRHARVTQTLAAAAVVASLAALVVWKTSQLVGDVG